MKIKCIDSKKIIFEDGQEYEFLESDPPPSSWTKDDDYDTVDKEYKKEMKKTIVINKSKKNQQRLAVYIRGGISKGFDPKIELGENYPDKWLGKDWRIKDLLENGLIIVADPSPNGSKWKPGGLTNMDASKLEIGQVIQISKGISKISTYHMKISYTDIIPFDVSFMGWQESQFKLK